MIQVLVQVLDILAMIQGMIQDLKGIIQALVQDLQVVQELFTIFNRFWIFGWNTKGTSRCFMGWQVDG